MKFNTIPFLKDAKHAKLIHEGFSEDEKWNVDECYLLRFYPKSNIETLTRQANLIEQAYESGCQVPNVYDLGVWEDTPYMIVDYVKGENAELMMDKLTEDEQYELGKEVGELLSKLHAVPIAEPSVCWDELWTNRVERLSPQYKEIFHDSSRHLYVIDFINDNLALMNNRPVAIQHYDLHPANIIVKHKKLAGMIDLQKITIADPYHEFYKMEYFTTPISQAYARGIIDGYHQDGVPTLFWQLHRLYAAIHIISAEVWGHKVALDQKDKFMRHTLRTLDEWDDFKREIPSWYNSEC
ncbi:aminoglycoside phosphotransferase family protein [Cytobacillus sp. Hm23]